MSEKTLEVVALIEPEWGVLVNGIMVAVCPDRASAEMVQAGLSLLNLASRPTEAELQSLNEPAH